MTFTYSKNLQDPKDWIRFRVGDIEEENHLLSDEEIYALLVLHQNNKYLALLDCIQSLIARLSKEFDKSIGDISTRDSQMVEHFRELYKEIREEYRRIGLGAETTIKNERVFRKDSAP